MVRSSEVTRRPERSGRRCFESMIDARIIFAMCFDDGVTMVQQWNQTTAEHLQSTQQERPEPPPRLMSLVRRRIRELRYSPRTEESYVHWILRYIKFHDRKHPKDMGASEVREFLSNLAVEQKVASATQNVALASLTFLYEKVLAIPLPHVDGIVPAKRPARVPIVLGPSELRRIFQRLEHPVSLCARLMYGSGLRVSECIALRIKDVDVERREIRGSRGGRATRIVERRSQIRVSRD